MKTKKIHPALYAVAYFVALILIAMFIGTGCGTSHVQCDAYGKVDHLQIKDLEDQNADVCSHISVE